MTNVVGALWRWTAAGRLQEFSNNAAELRHSRSPQPIRTTRRRCSPQVAVGRVGGCGDGFKDSLGAGRLPARRAAGIHLGGRAVPSVPHSPATHRLGPGRDAERLRADPQRSGRRHVAADASPLAPSRRHSARTRRDCSAPGSPAAASSSSPKIQPGTNHHPPAAHSNQASAEADDLDAPRGHGRSTCSTTGNPHDLML